MDPKEIAKLITEDPDILTESQCKECGKAEADSNDLCFECDYWIKQASAPRGRIVINGNQFRISQSSALKGFGGREFAIEMLDGRVVMTNNIWDQGPIPERFRRIIPDNAKAITDLEPGTQRLQCKKCGEEFQSEKGNKNYTECPKCGLRVSIVR